MRLGWIKSLAFMLGLLTFLSACQQGPSSRSYARTTAFSSGYGYGGCGYNRCGVYSRPACPPGQILARIPYSYGGPGRYCVPYYGRSGGCYGPRPSPPCGYGGRYARGYY